MPAVSIERERAALQTERRTATASGSEKKTLRRLHAQDRSPMRKHQAANVLLLSVCFAALLSWQAGWWPLTVLCWLTAGHFFHTKPLAFHDASHGTWHPVRWKNELMGVVLGTLILVPLSVYRYVHALHHASMSTERDPELWPFVVPGTPRWTRILAAFLEIVFGCVYTPLLFLRSVVAAKHIPAPTRRRMAAEYAGMILVWSGVLWLVHRNGWWEPFLVAFVVPFAIAGSYQTLRKYTEHLGLMGDSVLSGTRTVVAERPLSRLLSSSMQYADHHGTHHRYAKIPHYNLPTATPYVYGDQRNDLPVYPSYAAAFRDMVKSLADPKAGRQWLRETSADSGSGSRS